MIRLEIMTKKVVVHEGEIIMMILVPMALEEGANAK